MLQPLVGLLLRNILTHLSNISSYRQGKNSWQDPLALFSF